MKLCETGGVANKNWVCIKEREFIVRDFYKYIVMILDNKNEFVQK